MTPSAIWLPPSYKRTWVNYPRSSEFEAEDRLVMKNRSLGEIRQLRTFSDRFISSQNISSRLFWSVLGVILALALIIILLSPSEQTLGSGIKSVYIHVALTWTGMSGFFVAGAVGLVAALFARPQLQKWAHTIAWVALAMFGAGLVMSAWAAIINWGAMFWLEPRSNSALQLLAAGLIVQVINSWSVSYRIKGALNFLLSLFLLWSVISTPLVLHPGSAARSSPSSAIRFTFFSLFVLCALAATWIVVYWRGRKVRQSPKAELEFDSSISP